MIIGSAALGYWLHKSYGGDIDIISEKPVQGPGIEHHPLSVLNNADAMSFATSETLEVDGQRWAICSLRGLALIKRSHMHRLLKWDRNMFMLREINWSRFRDSLSPTARRFLRERTRMTKQEYSSPSLNKSNAEFFDDYVEKHFDHDSVHEYVAYGERPIYEQLKTDMSLAKCDRNLWEKLSQEDKIKCVLEECYVIGLERWLVPARLKGERVMPAKMAALKGLKKVCTTLCSGWFRDFAIDYHEEIAASVDGRKMEMFLKEKCDVQRSN